MFDLDQADEDDSNADDGMELLGFTRTKVVGVRYYTGEANLDEMVLLIREPNNPYDRWAIRVDNVRGAKIGHISREQAAVLSPLIDKGQLRIEGLVQGAKGAYTMPIDLIFFTPLGAVDEVTRRLRSAGIVMGRSGGGAGGGGSGGGGGGRASGSGSGTGGLPGVSYVAPMPQSELDSSLERMFDEIHATAALQPAMEPDAEVLSRLFPHQRVALAWMIARENGNMLPPFWEEKPRPGGAGTRYLNTLTNFSTAERPAPLRGGILADDMGLGKTLTIIALLATNRPGVSLPPVQMISLAAEDAGAGAAAATAAPAAVPAAGGSAADGTAAGTADGAAAGTAAGAGALAAPAVAAAPQASGKAKKAKRKQKPGAKGGQKAARRARDEEEAGTDDDDDDDGGGDDGDEEYVPAPKRQKTSAGGGRGAAAAAAAAVPAPAKARTKAASAKAAAAARAPAPQPAAQAPAPAQTQQLAAVAQQPPRPDGPRCTLIVCPVSVMSNWMTQIQEHTAGNLKVYEYHGPDRSRSPAFLAGHDVMLTTYSVLGGDLADGRGLLSVRWLRVVLDEAHTVKNPKAKWSQAAAKLKAERRWAVTGTPIQNRLTDLYGLLSYLALEPLHEKSIFNRTLERPLKACDPRAVKKLQVLMGSIAMRRTKDLQIGGRPLVVLPRKTVNLVTVHLTREDRVKYDALELEGRRVISHALESSTLLQNYMNVLEIILRLRQVADAGCLCAREALRLTEGLPAPSAGGKGAAWTDEERQGLLGLLTAGLQDDCPICLEPLNQTACITRCRHIFCRPCVESVLARAAGPGCPMCRAPLAAAELLDLPPDAALVDPQTQAGNDVADPRAASAKVSALLEALQAAAAQQPADGSGPIKSVVFSQFTGMLNLVSRALAAAGIAFVRLDGSTPAKERAQIVRAFASRAPGSPVVFLVSLKAGGVGMNLTAASHVHLLDPWWNPAVEEQAMDRVHRLGQTRDVEVFRYVAADTIEERMLQLQDRKRELANAAFDKRSAEENRQMRIDDVRLLMDL